MCSSLSRLSSSLIHRLARTRCQGQAELITSRSFSVSTRSINFVRGVIEEAGWNNLGGSQFPRYNIEQNADIVHVKLMKNNTFVTVTDSKGNKKLGASAGSLPDMKGGPKLAKYSAEATAEHVGRMSRNFGLKSVVMKVKGFSYFKKKRQAIISWKEGFTSSRAGHSPIVYIEDRTRKPHNGCRLPKQCRI
nr:probable ribosomal protein S11, mitochondrial isoform X2 [Malus domestica]XP_028957720.1 probable ribosomal protein S11, mitochondrial isoform X2 [Malus domestica]XP_028957721.1 probable ribosomal protein S11, mitochondrial isoform X2 [Malus domestica]